MLDIVSAWGPSEAGTKLSRESVPAFDTRFAQISIGCRDSIQKVDRAADQVGTCMSLLGRSPQDGDPLEVWVPWVSASEDLPLYLDLIEGWS